MRPRKAPLRALRTLDRRARRSRSLDGRALGRRVVGMGLLGPALVVWGCSGSAKKESTLPPEAPRPLVEPNGGRETNGHASETPADPPLPWVESTYSPRPGSAFDPEVEGIVVSCGRGDVALHEVAGWVAEAHHRAGEAPNLDAVTFHLRRRGSPYVMPRLWSATMSGVSEEELEAHVAEWLGKRPALGEYRCGAGVFAAEDGSRTVSLLQADVVADLGPVPTSTPENAWLDLSVRFLVPTTAASIVLLPPEGSPRTIATDVELGAAKSRISLSMPGPWLVQIMATQEGGPRPVLTAMVTAGEDPPSGVDERPVPGEGAFDDKLPPSDALFVLINAARADAGLSLLRRDKALDQVARAHSQAMLASGRISHDTGRGDPAHRVERAGLSPRATGENVALAASVPRLHRVLWASPSHRENLLMRRWDRAGVAVVERDDGILFATQLFTDVE